MAFRKVSPSERVGKGVYGLPDSPQLSKDAIQTRFDSLGNLGIDALNDLSDELTAATAAANMGAMVPPGVVAEGTVQSILNGLKASIAGIDVNLEEKIDNVKAELEAVDADLQEQIDDIVEDLPGQITTAVDEWLDEHPEATTTVEDGSITDAKLYEEVSEAVFGNNYYDEVVYTKIRAYDTTCYFVEVPKFDSDGEVIDPYINKASSGITPLGYARSAHTTLTVNGSVAIKKDGVFLSGNLLSRGEIINSNTIAGAAENFKYVSINRDRTFREYAVNGTTAQYIQENGGYNVFTAYFKLVENGVAVDNSETLNNEGANVSTTKNPFLAVGLLSDGTILYMAADVRTGTDAGLNSVQASQLMIDHGCVNAWALDGGGSTSVSVKESKLNRNIDGSGTEDRNISITQNVKRDTVDFTTARVMSKIGEEKQNTIQQVIPYVNYVKSKLLTEMGTAIPAGADLNDYTTTGKYYSGNGTRTATLINCPFTNRGFVLYVVQHTSLPTRFMQFILKNYPEVRLYYRYIRSPEDEEGEFYQPWMLSPYREEVDGLADQVQTASDAMEEERELGYLRKNILRCDKPGLTVSGVTVTRNSDGSYVLNGICTARTDIDFAYAPPADGGLGIEPGSYLFSGGIDNTLFLGARVSNPDGSERSFVWSTETSDKAFTLPAGKVIDRVYTTIYADTIYDNVVYRPMIRPAEITDGTFKAYAPSNAEINTSIMPEFGEWEPLFVTANSPDGVPFTASRKTFMRQGNIVFLQVRGTFGTITDTGAVYIPGTCLPLPMMNDNVKGRYCIGNIISGSANAFPEMSVGTSNNTNIWLRIGKDTVPASQLSDATVNITIMYVIE